MLASPGTKLRVGLRIVGVLFTSLQMLISLDTFEINWYFVSWGSFDCSLAAYRFPALSSTVRTSPNELFILVYIHAQHKKYTVPFTNLLNYGVPSVTKAPLVDIIFSSDIEFYCVQLACFLICKQQQQQLFNKV